MVNLEQMVDDLSSKKAIAFDLETIGLDPRYPRADIICVSLCGEPGKSYVLLYDHPENQIGKQAVKEALDHLFAQDKKWIAHNGKFDCLWLGEHGFTVPNLTHDTIIMAYLLDENSPKNVASVAARYLGIGDWKYLMDDHFDKIKRSLQKGTSIPYPPLDDLVKYAALDTDVELRLARKLWPKLDKSQRRLHDFLIDVSKVLESVEKTGVHMNPEDIDRKLEEYERIMEETQRQLSEATGLPLDQCNPNSPAQMVRLLFDHLGLSVVDTTTTGNPSAGEHTLKTYQKQHPEVIEPILKYKKASKFSGSYLRPWKQLLTPENRLRGSYNITKNESGGGTTTGRLSCSNLTPWGGKGHGMSLHQVPRQDDIRQVVSAGPGRLLIVADYSQIELRVVAALAEEPRMMEAYRKDEDLHILTAAAVTGKDPSEITKEERTNAKPVNFGYVYGMGAKNFVRYAFDEYGIEFTLEESEAMRRGYFRLYRGLRPWHKRVERTLRRQGFVVSPLGRVRHLPDIYSPNKAHQYEAVRQAINAPVQATASDFTLMAMVLLHERFQRDDLCGRAYLIGQVHDSVLIETDANIAVPVGRLVKRIMEKRVPLEIRKRFGYHFPVPIKADAEITRRWGAKSLKTVA